jgi:glycosyltransferase involved in cell wall biosynthesis
VISEQRKVKSTTVRLFFRRANPTGNVSIENSFDCMLAHFSSEKEFKVDIFRSSFYSIGFWQRLKAVLEVRQNRADVNHVTGDTNFFALSLPRRRTILTIHDCGLLDGKGRFARWVLQTFWLRLPVWHSRIVTVVSEATRRDVLRLTGCSPQKIVVIPTVIKSNFSHKPKEFNQNHPTFLHIGNSPNKNLERHAAALQGLPCRLHVIGDISAAQIRLLNDLKINYQISINLTDEQMREAYENADVLLFCSLIEGFGMPILEAQTVGRVVITSNISAMPEVAGDGACLVGPLSINEIRTAIDRVLIDEIYRNTLINNGLQNIRRFNPSTVAQQYADLYVQILGECNR